MDSHTAEATGDGPVLTTSEGVASLKNSVARIQPHSRQYQQGRPLVQVLAAYNIHAELPGDELYGNTTLRGALGTPVIYKRDKDDYERLGPDGKLSLIRNKAASAADSFYISINLLQRHVGPISDSEVSCGEILWNSYDATNPYDVVQSEVIKGRDGSVRVDYVVMSDAAEALVTVIPMDGGRGKPTNIYGEIVAKTKYGQHTVFRADSTNREQSSADPLVRSEIQVSMDDILEIHMSLYTQEKAPTNDDEKSKGIVRFSPTVFQLTSERFEGAFGEVEVKAVWS